MALVEGRRPPPYNRAIAPSNIPNITEPYFVIYGLTSHMSHCLFSMLIRWLQLEFLTSLISLFCDINCRELTETEWGMCVLISMKRDMLSVLASIYRNVPVLKSSQQLAVILQSWLLSMRSARVHYWLGFSNINQQQFSVWTVNWVKVLKRLASAVIDLGKVNILKLSANYRFNNNNTKHRQDTTLYPSWALTSNCWISQRRGNNELYTALW